MPSFGVRDLVKVTCQMWLYKDATFSGGKIHISLKSFLFAQ